MINAENTVSSTPGEAQEAPTAARRPRDRRHAVIFSGNGFNAAYEVGVLKAILQGVSPSTRGEKIQPEIYAGTSVGAYNAAFMVSESDESDIAAAERLEQSWSTEVSPRFRANPFNYLDPRFFLPNPITPLVELGKDAVHLSRDLLRRTGDLFASLQPTRPLAAVQDQIFDYEWDILADVAPMRDHLRSRISLDRIRKSSKELRITAANWKLGTTRTFDRRHFVGESGYQAIIAAMAIPGGVPRQDVDREEYVDGAMLMKHPLNPAIEAARGRRDDRQLTLHVIYLDPEAGRGPLSDVRGSFSIVYRLFLLAFSRAVNADIEGAERTNRALQFLDLLRDFDPGSEVMWLWSRLNQETVDKLPVEIHRYRSTKHLGGIGDLFIADESKLETLIRSGYEDAAHHDCVESDCVRIAE